MPAPHPAAPAHAKALPPLLLSPAQRLQLEGLVRSACSAEEVVRRARIVLLSAEGHGPGAICRQLGITPPTVRLWRDRFTAHGVEGLQTIVRDACAARQRRQRERSPVMPAALLGRSAIERMSQVLLGGA